MLEVPAVVQSRALVSGAAWWLEQLPDLVGWLAAEWSLVVGRAFPDATEAFVAAVEVDGGTPAVLKVLLPRDGLAAAHEITVLRLAGGDGCARLLRHDAEHGALLLERLGPSLHDLGLPLARRLDILVATAQRVWRPAAGSGLPTGAAKGRWLIEHVTTTWEALDRPCSARAVDDAVACAERRIAAHDDELAVLVHGDVHQWNALRAPDGFRLVDPDGLLAEPAYDLGVLMREDSVALLAGDPWSRARWLAARTGLDATAIWEWGVVERVATGLLAAQVGLQAEGSAMLAVADQVAG